MTAPTSDEVLREALETFYRLGSYHAAARALSVDRNTARKRVRDAKARGITARVRISPQGELVLEDDIARLKAQQGWAPDFDLRRAVPDGLTLKGTSIRYDRDGGVGQYWNKTRLAGRDPDERIKVPNGRVTGTYTLYDQQGQVITQGVSEKAGEVPVAELIEGAFKAFFEDREPIAIPEGPSKFDSDVIPWFQMGDAHLGMLAHEAETGANFDLKIAERELCAAFAALIDESPARERAVLNDLGDATHYENMRAATEHSGHLLDADGRFPKMIGVYVRVMRFIIERMLKKYRIVDVLINRGNHSETNDIWMAELLRQVYSHTDRVNVLPNTSLFVPYRMGNTFVLVHHSHKTKAENLISIMAHDYRQDWGETEYHYVDVGHLHHKWAAREDWGCVIEMWNTLAEKDKWHHDSGYRSLQSLTRVDRSRTYGEVGRRVLPIKEIRDIIVRAYGAGAVYMPPERRRVFSV
jgi:hypothetical protein